MPYDITHAQLVPTNHPRPVFIADVVANAPDDEINASAEGVVLDGATDNAVALAAAMTKAEGAGKTLAITGAGVCMVGEINHNLTGPLRVRVGDGVTIKGVAGLSTPIFTLDGGSHRYPLSWRGGTIDNSQRIFLPEVLSGTCLNVKRHENFDVFGITFQGGADYTTPVGDTGFGPQECRRGTISHCRFNGQGDLGIYITGGGSNDAADDHGDIIVTNNHFYRCNTGVSAKRQSPRTIITNNIFYECGVGASLWEASSAPTILPGRQAVISNNIFKFCESRAIETRVYGGTTITGNLIEDFGYSRDGSPVAAGWGIRLLGSTKTLGTGNIIRMRDWTTHSELTGIYIANITIDGVDYTAEKNSFVGNSIHDIYAGVREASTGLNNYDNTITGYTTAFSGLDPASAFTMSDNTGQGRVFVGSNEMFRINGPNVFVRGLRFFETLSSAAVPGSFSATKYLAVKDASSTVYYIPLASAPW